MNSGGFKVTGWCWSCVQIGLTACCQRQGPLSPTVAVISIAGLSCWWHWNPVWDGESAQWADFKKQHNICQAKVGYGGFISKHKSKLQLVNWLWNKIVPHIDGPEKCFFFSSFFFHSQTVCSVCTTTNFNMFYVGLLWQFYSNFTTMRRFAEYIITDIVIVFSLYSMHITST